MTTILRPTIALLALAAAVVVGWWWRRRVAAVEAWMLPDDVDWLAEYRYIAIPLPADPATIGRN